LASSAAAGSITTFVETALGSPGICTQLHCDALGAIVAGGYLAQNYQVPGVNTGTEATPVPGPWASPIDPPQATGPLTLNILAFVPVGSPPTGGWPVVVFGHGFTRSKGDLTAIASQMAAAGIATISVDWPLHGDRAVQIYPTGS